ncbi:MAG TPA: hypothetical protein VF509_10045 [Sphingobium sp.]
MDDRSTLSILTRDVFLVEQVAGWLTPHGWFCQASHDEEQAVAHIHDGAAIILLDGAMGVEIIASTIGRIRELHGFVAGTPTLLYAEADFEPVAGVSNRIDPPLSEVGLVAGIEDWVGRVGDHGFRHADNPPYRMMRLAGRERASALFVGFARSLSEALDALNEGQNITRIAHNIAGMAGTMGFAALSKQWSAVDHGDMSALPQARDMAQHVLHTLNG